MRDFVDRGTMGRGVWFPHLCPGSSCSICKFARTYGHPQVQPVQP